MATNNIRSHFLDRWNRACIFVFSLSCRRMDLSAQRNESTAVNWSSSSILTVKNKNEMQTCEWAFVWNKYAAPILCWRIGPLNSHLIGYLTVVDCVRIALRIIDSGFDNPLMIKSRETRRLIEQFVNVFIGAVRFHLQIWNNIVGLFEFPFS